MKKKMLRSAGILILSVLVCLCGALLYVKVGLPNVGAAPDLKVELTPARIARGKYLANNVAVCMDCHSKRDWSKLAGPPIDNTLGMGGEEFNQEMGMPGQYFAPNITPAGIGHWSDGELLKAITSGVTPSGRALFPLMNHPAYGKMDQEDALSIVAYLRTLEPIENQVPESHSDFPMNFIINTIPQKASFQPIPTKRDTVAYGKYLVEAASCGECHSQNKNGERIPGMEFAGGVAFKFPSGGTVQSANITPHPQVGIGAWSKQTFINRFKSYANYASKNTPVQPGEFNTPMPWTMFADMTEEDLGAIYTYLQTLKPIENAVVRFTREGESGKVLSAK